MGKQGEQSIQGITAWFNDVRDFLNENMPAGEWSPGARAWFQETLRLPGDARPPAGIRLDFNKAIIAMGVPQAADLAFNKATLLATAAPLRHYEFDKARLLIQLPELNS